MRLRGRVSIEELDAHANIMGFSNWGAYRLTLSDAEIARVFGSIYRARKDK